MFVGRIRELKALTSELDNGRPSLIVLYGRRRVGKSTLLQKAIEGRPSIYYQATRVTDADSQSLIKAAVSGALGSDPVLESISGWEGIFAYLERAGSAIHAGRGQALVVVLDEFPYLCEDNRALPSIIQKVWDGVRRAGVPLKLVLCGSHIAFMEDLLAERNPLHGRQSRELEVGPLPFREAAALLPGWDADALLRAYGIFGGMPYYLSLCDPGEDLAANVRRLVLEDGAPLREEPIHLLQAELQAPARYASILRAVADGLTQWGEILNRVTRKGEPGNSIAPYIDRLERMRLIRRMQSLDVPVPEKSRATRYYLDDPFLAFHYRFVLPNASALQAGYGEAVYRMKIEPALDEFMGGQFEDVCRAWVALCGEERLGVPAQTVGKIWTGEYDLDVAGELLDGRRFAGECKWWKRPVGANVYRDLKAETGENRYFGGTPPAYLLFARSGFTAELRKEAAKEGAVLLTPAELLSSSP
jgi:AAA+ ATPase superfamily predicted ATPase